MESEPYREGHISHLIKHMLTHFLNSTSHIQRSNMKFNRKVEDGSKRGRRSECLVAVEHLAVDEAFSVHDSGDQALNPPFLWLTLGPIHINEMLLLLI